MQRKVAVRREVKISRRWEITTRKSKTRESDERKINSNKVTGKYK